MEAPSKRPYRMKARAEAAAATGERILDAAIAVFWQRPVHDIPLEEVARRAGVSMQTVIRRFGGKQGLFAAAAERETERVRLRAKVREAMRSSDGARRVQEAFAAAGGPSAAANAFETRLLDRELPQKLPS